MLSMQKSYYLSLGMVLNNGWQGLEINHRHTFCLSGDNGKIMGKFCNLTIFAILLLQVTAIIPCKRVFRFEVAVEVAVACQSKFTNRFRGLDLCSTLLILAKLNHLASF